MSRRLCRPVGEKSDVIGRGRSGDALSAIGGAHQARLVQSILMEKWNN